MLKVIFCIGLPASGKSFWAKDFCKTHTDYVRVNRDDLRFMRGAYWLPKDEDMITEMEYFCILAALKAGKNVVVDATNLKALYLNNIKKFIDDNMFEVEYEEKVFDTPLNVCIERDKNRPKEEQVGAEVIRGMYNKYAGNKISKTEIKQNPQLPHVIICDLDGTLAIHNGRGPYDEDKVDTDLVNAPILTILNNWLDESPFHKCIFVSGRTDSCQEKTINWLISKCLLVPQYLYMRKTGDRRSDDIVKKEIFDQYIKDNYYVEFVLDDRQKVVNMWRSLGLTVLQVNEGDF